MSSNRNSVTLGIYAFLPLCCPPPALPHSFPAGAAGALVNPRPAGLAVWLTGRGWRAARPSLFSARICWETQPRPRSLSPPAVQLKVLLHTGPREAPAEAGTAWPERGRQARPRPAGLRPEPRRGKATLATGSTRRLHGALPAPR